MSFDRDLEKCKGITYECVRCGYRFDGSELAERGRIVCPECSYKVIRKVRPPRVKRITNIR